MGYHYSQSTIRAKDQTRSTSTEYIYSARKGPASKKLKIYTQTMAKKILFKGKQATGE